ncbi:hypothetical protein [Paraburkholderia caballeronis]|uniref:Lipoprotein n=1 Tax=Paraburkholderia caballeronis TaxID=416943 RepID=A0A1H7UND3_9BURK|nr:hypothetical protein [Paraburkholderia caballeronis]PXW26588.1 hypothetical protein C7403_104469 [Paraburkholderia caballeronis]PXX02135.1 hypothetical protein C7407_104469 [Paraburkholderia caballeronis]RAK01292.1 hypothetical protein C7409_104469 [Paraburkholderia caballeronis]SEB86898.1 hypothetical protein SAMN05445871_1224 [Paraburkholderia caballeronis]SEL98158.1 hypothetical protein SAMN05192542_1202 [Paraburkholderia caballeronis]
MKRILAVAALALLCAACAQGGPPSGGGGISMYGTVDEGITFHHD